MKKRKMKDLAAAADITPQWLAEVVSGRSRPSWDLALKLAEATETTPVLWMQASERRAEISAAVENFLYREERAYEDG
jgi:transcriptional regulator with XRE-family HTH domain